jgi:L-lactate dehydrogenase complex protein LldG
MTQELFTTFQKRLQAAKGECYQFEHLSEAAIWIASQPALAAKEIIVPPDFAERKPWGQILSELSAQGIHVVEAESAARVADAPAGLSNAELAIAETGSVMLAENTLQARIVSMLTLTHFILVRTADLYPMLDEAGARLQQFTKPGPDQRRYISLVTGPSRTADIERTLTVGVQGPGAVHVLFINSEEAS